MFRRIITVTIAVSFSFAAWAVAPRFMVAGAVDAPTVQDSATGLEWQQRSTLSADVTWKDALSHCENLVYAGHNDWRLPNIRALMSIVDEKKETPPAINTVFFKGFENMSYWTSTTDRRVSANAAVIYFDEANTAVGRGGVTGLPKSSKANVICVRTVP